MPKTQQMSGFFQSHQKRDLYWQAWIADPSFRYNIVIHHGLGEHSGRYKNILSSFAKERLTIFSYDAYGHGKSKGKRGAARSIGEFVLDLELFLTMLKKEFGVKKPILYAHSMGALIAVHFALARNNQERLQALILSAIPIRPILNFSQRLKLAIGRGLSKLLSSIILPSGLPARALSHDPKVIRAYIEDPLVHKRIRLALALELAENKERLLKKARGLYIPSLIIHGEEDLIVSSSGSKELYEGLPSKDKKLVIYPGLYHEIHNELLPQRQEALEELRTWTMERIVRL